MVVVDDLEMKLVWANEEKTPFLEHDKEGVTYIEAEPDAEFYVAVRRVSNIFPGTMGLTIQVDGKDLGWKVACPEIKSVTYWQYFGLKSGDGTTSKCLRFVKPRILDNKNGAPLGCKPDAYLPLMGRIMIKVFEIACVGTEIRGPSHPNYSLNGDLTTDAAMVPSQREASKLKFVRTSTGSKTNNNDMVGIFHKTYRKINKLDEIELRYATMPGLIKAGLFPSAPASAPTTASNSNSTISGDVSADSIVSNPSLRMTTKKRALLVSPSPVSSQDDALYRESQSNKCLKVTITREVDMYDLSQED